MPLVRLGSNVAMIDTWFGGSLGFNLTLRAGRATITGQLVAYTRVSTLDQSAVRQLDGVVVDRTFGAI